jgi:hypothetical protein
MPWTASEVSGLALKGKGETLHLEFASAPAALWHEEKVMVGPC